MAVLKAFLYRVKSPDRERTKCVTKLSFDRDCQLSVADHSLLISGFFFIRFAQRFASCTRASASREFTCTRRKKEKSKRNECTVPRTKKRIIKNFSLSDSEKARMRSFARVDRSIRRSFLEQITVLRSQKRGSIRSRERSAMYGLVALYLRSTLTTKARPFQSGGRHRTKILEKTQGDIQDLAYVSLIVIHGKNPTETEPRFSDDPTSII